MIILLKCSDFPFVVEQCGYSNVISLAKNTISLTDEEAEWIMGKTAMSLFKNSWIEKQNIDESSTIET